MQGESIAETFGNRVVVSKFALDLACRDPVALVWRVKHQNDALKLSPEPWVSRAFLQLAIPLLPPSLVLELLFDTYAQVPSPRGAAPRVEGRPSPRAP